MTFRFTMIDSDMEIVSCEISNAALTDLSGSGASTKSKEKQFLQCRDRIEGVAAAMHQRHPAKDIVLFSKHFKKHFFA